MRRWLRSPAAATGCAIRPPQPTRPTAIQNQPMRRFSPPAHRAVASERPRRRSPAKRKFRRRNSREPCQNPNTTPSSTQTRWPDLKRRCLAGFEAPIDICRPFLRYCCQSVEVVQLLLAKELRNCLTVRFPRRLFMHFPDLSKIFRVIAKSLKLGRPNRRSIRAPAGLVENFFARRHSQDASSKVVCSS